MGRRSFDNNGIIIKNEHLNPVKYIPPHVKFWELHPLERDLYS